MLLVAAAATAIALPLVFVPRSVARRHPVWLAIVWLLVGAQQQALLRTLTPFTFEQMFVSDTANSFYGAAKQHRAAAVLRHFLTLRRSLPLHAQSNMPGKTLFASALAAITGDAAQQAWIVFALSSAGAALLYLVVWEWFEDRDTALFSLVLYLCVPARLYFLPLLNTVTPTLALACAWLFMRWVRTGRMTYAASLGIALYGVLLFDPLPLVLGLLFVAILAHALHAGTIAARTVLRHGAVGIAAFAAVHVFMLSTFHFDVLRTFNALRIEAAAFNVDEDRPYRVWVVRNLFDFWFGVGVCQVVLFVAVLVDGLRRPARRRVIDRPIALAALALAAMLMALDAMGGNRGEVIRLWLFLACFWQIPAAYACARLGSRTAFGLVLAATIVQDALGTAMIGFVSP